jgi:hypothetical protein
MLLRCASIASKRAHIRVLGYLVPSFTNAFYRTIVATSFPKSCTSTTPVRSIYTSRSKHTETATGYSSRVIVRQHGVNALSCIHITSGSKRNWLALSKAFLRDLNRPIYTLVSQSISCLLSSHLIRTALGPTQSWRISACSPHDV